jgi:hypothetical protein
MNTLPNPDEQVVAFENLVKLRYWRLNSSKSDEQIATQKLGFESAEHMYQQLKKWRWPDWAVYKDLPKPKRQAEKKRRGSGKGERVELPPAKEAAPLFKEALDKLLEAMEFLQRDYESASSSRYNKEYLHGELFFQYTREEAHWADNLGRERVTPARRSPGHGLTELIAAYLLVYGDPEPLIEKLHLDPDSLDREKLRKHIEGDKDNSKPGLLGSAENVAILIRGGKHVRSGLPAGEFDVDEQIINRRIRQGLQEGHSDQQIIELLAEEGISTSKAVIKRLARVSLPGGSS